MTYAKNSSKINADELMGGTEYQLLFNRDPFRAGWFTVSDPVGDRISTFFRYLGMNTT